jgi:PIN domain nuclease of toxin-antitoxin system
LRLLLDTHALIWALAGSRKLTRRARGAIASQDNEILVSAASAMEVATKVRLGKLPEADALARDFESALTAADYVGLPITVAHAAHAGNLAIGHKDPFDRLLIAQAQIERVPLVSNEALFDQFGIERLW